AVLGVETEDLHDRVAGVGVEHGGAVGEPDGDLLVPHPLIAVVDARFDHRNGLKLLHGDPSGRRVVTDQSDVHREGLLAYEFLSDGDQLAFNRCSGMLSLTGKPPSWTSVTGLATSSPRARDSGPAIRHRRGRVGVD